MRKTAPHQYHASAAICNLASAQSASKRANEIFGVAAPRLKEARAILNGQGCQDDR
jgi:hypothetical protein